MVLATGGRSDAPAVVWLVIVERSKTGDGPDVRGAFATIAKATACAKAVATKLRNNGHDVWNGGNPHWDCDVHVVQMEVTR